ncbi:protein mono-ADP-ribosyltransferase PARP14 isoform X1 [Etheostoma spectabile]|uniref:protein mono-ADP-ribosyltransferase PARP14 isoform X1 n=1 Tax=Etheostoma spectabile TaxID=54343 RepID=UPI0013AF5E03|nr:protein mono-ADP-ribosyltransferase PARP14-like isoform X1 [Etheostoma spectabile]
MEGNKHPPPVIVEGDWSPDQTKTMKNKLQLYFQSKKKSSGGDCRVVAEDGAPRAAVYFKSEEVRERVLARQNHEITLENQTVKLRLISASSPTNSDGVSDSLTDSKTPKSEAEPGNGDSTKSQEESVQSVAVVLDNVSDSMSPDMLSMLVENISGLDESCYSLEIIWETNRAVVTFNKPEDVEKFLSVSESTQKLQKRGLSARPLEAAESVRVESLPPTVVKDMLELYFEKSWALPENIVMIPSEQAAIATFNNPKVVECICIKQDIVMRSIPIKVYPYYKSLGTALYGSERPTWKMPEPFTESVHHVVWKFLLMKKLLKTINDQMRPYFCSVDLDNPEVKLSPLPSFLRQQGLTAKRVDNWMNTALEAFRQQMSQYTAFECAANARAWKAAEKEVRSVVREDAVLVLDASRGTLTVAGRATDIKQIRAPVENIVLKAMSQMKRQTEGVSEVMVMSPAEFYILQQNGVQKAAQDISPDMNLSFDEGTQTLTITGLPAEVYQTKSWILERNVAMSKKQLNVPTHLLDFLKTVDPMDMSQDLFTSQSISAIYSIESKGVFLLGSSESVLAVAENKMKTVFGVQTLDVEDQEVLKLQNWVSLNQQLLDTYNSLKKKTVAIQIHPERRDKVTVAGFQNPVKEVSSSLKEFIVNYSRVQETIRVESCAVIQFIDKKKSQDWSSIAKNNDVEVRFDPERPRITLAGARLHVQKAKICFQKLTSALSTDNFIVDKPGAKKYFQTQGSLFLSTIMTELSCVVMLRPENQDEEEEENCEEDNDLCYCKVKTPSGVLISVSKADICSFHVDTVVNAANEDLQHIGGLALALLKAAGPELQKLSNDHVAKSGKLSPGDAIVTGACNLPCKYVIHAVGPRFSDFNRQMSVSRLKLAVKNSLAQAEGVNCSTIALPAISSGVFGFPVELCAETIAQAVRDYCDNPGGPRSLTEIHLVDNNDKTVRVLATAVNKKFMDLGPTMTVPHEAGGRGTGAAGRYQVSRGKSHSPRDGRFGEGGGRRKGAEGAGAGLQGGLQGNRGAPGGHAWPGGNGGSGRIEQTTAEGLKIVLWKGNIQDQTTAVIVNTISEDMKLNQGAVSKAILQAAGHGLQSAVLSEAGARALPYGDVVITDGFNLKCRKVYHAVCPFWNNGAGQEELISIIRYCLEKAEKSRMASLSFPAIGTGNLCFPRDVVSRVLLQEIHSYSRRKTPRHLREVAIVVHPSDNQTVDCFTRGFKGQTGQRNIQTEALEFNEAPVRSSVNQSQQSPASFSQVSSPSLGVYRMQMGQLTLEVSSGDITKEACDVIVNSSNQSFNLKSGVSKAILDRAGLTVELECSQIVNSPNYQPGLFILTLAGKLPSTHIIHVVGQNDPAKIKDVVYTVLKFCEENKLSSISFPALGTGQGGADPSAVADAMVDGVVDFVRKKQPRFVCSVKILIFQTVMMTEFHKSMKKREGEQVEAKGVFTRFKDSVTSFFMGLGEERPNTEDLFLEREEFEPTVFQLCADNDMTVSQAKKRVEELIVAEQAERTITDQYISQLSQADLDQLNALQRKLTVSIRLNRGMEDQESNIHLEGLTRDVHTAESAVRDIIRKVERSENLKSKALLLSGLVEWQFEISSGVMVPLDIYTNLHLEEALEKKQQSVAIKINNEKYHAQVMLRKAVSANGRKEIELHRKEVKEGDADLPSNWEDMKGDLLKRVPLTLGSKEYNDVVTELTKTGLAAKIISIERVQNTTLWQSYQLMKKQMEVKNKHTNNERVLFHGTGASSIDLINKQGFNRSYAGAHGAMYGNGSYFAVDPVYSAQGYAKPDVKGHKRVYVARVLIGDFTQGRAGMITPPSKNSRNAADLYDSVADNQTNPTIFVVFNDIQAYPEYLITFT